MRTLVRKLQIVYLKEWGDTRRLCEDIWFSWAFIACAGVWKLLQEVAMEDGVYVFVVKGRTRQLAYLFSAFSFIHYRRSTVL